MGAAATSRRRGHARGPGACARETTGRRNRVRRCAISSGSEHVRVWNAEWNYFDGLDADRIEAIRQRDATWHRPTWPLGGLGARATDAGFAGPFAEPDAADGTEPDAAPEAPASPERRRALASLGLAADASHNEVKARYKTLAKRHHPDANGGCKHAEERLKRINEAYSCLSGGEGAR